MTLVPRSSTYIGGNGRDEINAVEVTSSDVYLGGATESTDLAQQTTPAGATDALFVLCDPFGAPTRTIRFGGTGDDRLRSITPVETGRVLVAGSSDSRDWLNTFYGINTIAAGEDAFAASVRFSAFAFGTPYQASPITGNTLYLGKDLQISLPVRVTSEAGFPGLVSVTSSDPERLLVSPRNDVAGSGRILLSEADETNGREVTLQALADSGDVDIILEGVSAAGGAGPRQRLRVRLAPSALFLDGVSTFYVGVNEGRDITYRQAVVLPDGRRGDSQRLRAGVTHVTGLTSSDPSGLVVRSDSLWTGGNSGSYRITVKALREGTYTLTPTSTLIPTAEGQSGTVIVGASPSRVFGDQVNILARSHTSSFWLVGAAGDALHLVTSDGSRLLISDGSSAYAENADLTFTSANRYKNLYVLARSSEGTVTVRATGMWQGKPVDDVLRIQLVPYKASWSAPSRVGMGLNFTFSLLLQPVLTSVNGQDVSVLTMAPYPSDFSALRLESSDATILDPGGITNSLTFNVIATRTGTAILRFASGTPAEFASISATVTVERQRLEFESEPVYLLPGANTTLFLSPTRTLAGSEARKAVRLRLTGSAPLNFGWQGTVTDTTFDFTNVNGYGVNLRGETTTTGQTASLWVSAPGIPEREIPIRVVTPLIIPLSSEMRVAASSTGPILMVVRSCRRGRRPDCARHVPDAGGPEGEGPADCGSSGHLHLPGYGRGAVVGRERDEFPLSGRRNRDAALPAAREPERVAVRIPHPDRLGAGTDGSAGKRLPGPRRKGSADANFAVRPLRRLLRYRHQQRSRPPAPRAGPESARGSERHQPGKPRAGLGLSAGFRLRGDGHPLGKEH